MEPTRIRDLVAVAVVAAVVGYLLTRFNYSSLPQIPRLAGLTALLLGVAEGVVAVGLRRRLRRRREALDPTRVLPRGTEVPPPVPPLVAARIVAVAKASALAAAALFGIWLGFAVYLLPLASTVTAARADTGAAVIGAVCAAVMLAGALLLEDACRTRDHTD